MKKWRRFVPRTRGDMRDPTAYEPDSLYAEARQIVAAAMHQAGPVRGHNDGLKHSAEAVKLLRAKDSRDSAYLLALLILQAPSAARAQHEMDEHRGGYRNREARLYELIDFNDTFVSTVLSLEKKDLAEFDERLRGEINRFCAQLHLAAFSDEQFEAITHGLSREIAVYRAARAAGYIVHMTSRVQDAMGVDMVITDPETKRSINIDVKTHSAFHFRLIELEHQDRMNEEKRLQCELAGFCQIRNGHGEKAVDTVLLRIATDRLGEINDFDFVDAAPLSHLIADALRSHGRYIV